MVSLQRSLLTFNLFYSLDEMKRPEGIRNFGALRNAAKNLRRTTPRDVLENDRKSFITRKQLTKGEVAKGAAVL